jgi:short-subunit dehydrogenase
MKTNNKTYLIFGVSKGLGMALTLRLPSTEDIVYGVSRTQPLYLENTPNTHWISADLSKPIEAVQVLKKEIDTAKIDYFIYNVGIWESDGFSENYKFDTVTQSEIINIINTNLTSCILTIQAFIENLRLSQNPKIIFIGSTWGLDNHNGKEVAFSATKFGLRGVIHSLRENLRQYRIGVSILNLGYLATEFEVTIPTEHILEKTNGELIPLTDVINAIKFITSTSYASCVKEINMPAMKDQNL